MAIISRCIHHTGAAAHEECQALKLKRLCGRALTFWHSRPTVLMQHADVRYSCRIILYTWLWPESTTMVATQLEQLLKVRAGPQRAITNRQEFEVRHVEISSADCKLDLSQCMQEALRSM